MTDGMTPLLHRIRACTACAGLPLGPRPILQASATARLLIVGQAPGRITHAKGRPFDDASGVRLRAWLGLTEAQFYDAAQVALVPMGFCFPGTGQGGDLPPRPECAPLWRKQLLALMPQVALTLVLGRHAVAWHLPEIAKSPIAQAARGTKGDIFVLPHPSPRNTRWLRLNPWFEAETLPRIRDRVADLKDARA